jgi:hypothetical protein
LCWLIDWTDNGNKRQRRASIASIGILEGLCKKRVKIA